jgi:hypothetical protein
MAEVVVCKPVDVVFDYVSDLRHMPNWWPTHQTYRRILGSGGPRTLYAWLMPHSPLPLGLPIGGLTVVTVFERPTRFAYRIVSPGLLSRMTYDFLGVPGGTRVSLEVPSAQPVFPDHVAPAFDALAATLESAVS